jgi:hypothetical protein
MAKYCDEFSFDEVFEDPSYVHVFVNKSRQVKSYPYPLQEAADTEEAEEEEEEEEDLDYSKEQELFEMKLNKLEFIKGSMTEEQLDRFWKEMSDSRSRCSSGSIYEKSKIYPIYDLLHKDEEEESKEACDLYFHREIMTV